MKREAIGRNPMLESERLPEGERAVTERFLYNLENYQMRGDHGHNDYNDKMLEIVQKF